MAEAGSKREQFASSPTSESLTRKIVVTVPESSCQLIERLVDGLQPNTWERIVATAEGYLKQGRYWEAALLYQLGAQGAAPSLTAVASEQPNEPSRGELHELVNALPPEQVEVARDLLRQLVGKPSSPEKTVLVEASDEEVMEAANQVIDEYRPALERLFKR